MTTTCMCGGCASCLRAQGRFGDAGDYGPRETQNDRDIQKWEERSSWQQAVEADLRAGRLTLTGYLRLYESDLELVPNIKAVRQRAEVLERLVASLMEQVKRTTGGDGAS